MERGARRIDSVAALRRIWRETRRTGLAPALLCSSFVAAIFNSALVLPLYLQHVTGLLGHPGPPDSITWSTTLTVGLLATGLAGERIANDVAARANSRICRSLVASQIHGQIRSGLRDFERLHRTDFLAAVAEIPELLQSQQLFMLQTGILSVLVTLFSVGLLAWNDAWLVVMALPFLGAICGVPIALAGRAGRYIDGEPQAFSHLGGFIEELVASRRNLHFSPEKPLDRRTRQLVDELHTVQTGKWWIWNLSFNVKLTLNLLLNATVLLVGGLLYLDGGIELGGVIGVYLLVTMITPKLDALYKLYNYAQSCSAAYRALDARLLPVEPRSMAAGAAPPIHSIALRIPEFRHGAGTPSLLENVAIDLKRGDRCLILGPSGSGKSTLLDLLVGTIGGPGITLHFDGRLASSATIAAEWRSVAYVPNPDLIFDRLTAADNLTLYGQPDVAASPEQADALAWSTFAQTSGGRLSDGERQRLVLLRALSRDRSVVILDEPVSALDADRANAALATLCADPDRIIVVASHNRGIEHHFTRILQMDGTAIVERRPTPA